jgi:hypothetical protein
MTMTSWDTIARTAERSSAPPIPDIPDDLYDAEVFAVGEPTESPDTFNPGKTRTTFWLDWAIESGDLPADTRIRQWIALPEAFLTDGFLSDKSRLFEVMEALGFDMEGTIHVDPREWVGLRARIMVENRPTQSTGELRPRVTAVKPARRQAQPPQRQTTRAVTRGTHPDAPAPAATAGPNPDAPARAATARANPEIPARRAGRPDPYAGQPESDPWE